MPHRLLALVAVFTVLWSATLAPQDSSPPLEPLWSKNFNRDYWVINTNISHEFGLRRNDDRMPRDLGTIDAVDTYHSTMLILEGPPHKRATLHAFDADTGTGLWQRQDVTLKKWRPLPSYVPARQVDAYYAQVIGSVAVLWLAETKASTACGAGPQLLALNIRTGEPLWCTAAVPDGDLTFIAIPERQMLLAWVAADPSVTLIAFDLRTGTTQWRHKIDVSGPDWLRIVSWLSGLPLDEARPPLHANGRVPLVASGAKRFGPMLRPPSEGRMQMIELASGKLLWEVAEPTDTRLPWFTWGFSDTSFFFTTGKRVNAYDVTSGEKRWSAALDDVRSVHVARMRQGDVIVVDLDPRSTFSMSAAPRKTGRGLAVLEPSTGRVIWRDDDARLLHGIEDPPSTLLLAEGAEVKVIDTVTGAESLRLRPPFQDEVRFARLLKTGHIVVQSATEVAVYEPNQTTAAYVQSIPRALRGIARPIISGILSPAFVSAIVIAEMGWPGVAGLRSRQIRPERDSNFAFFATGRGKQSRLIAVNVRDRTSRAVAPYIWGDADGFSLGNLVAEAHGLIYTMSGKSFAAYAFPIDEDEHVQTHRFAELQRVLDMRDRATAAATLERVGTARAEASAAIAILQRIASAGSDPNDSSVVSHIALADCHAILAEFGEGAQRGEHVAHAIASYQAALALVVGNKTGQDGQRGTEIEAQIERVKRLRDQR